MQQLGASKRINQREAQSLLPEVELTNNKRIDASASQAARLSLETMQAMTAMRAIAAPLKRAGTVCLLDDDPSVLKATSRLLLSDGWEVQSFSDPHSFLDYAETHRPQVVVIDIWMPIMSGLEVQERLRTLLPSARVIILTSKDDAAIRRQAMDAGAFAFFLKPVRDDEFLGGIEAAASKN